ncbi:MAG: PLDc N-terminal domain-containing protein [Clostridia bacterium]|nr:PLDc N-terminal domain-containing protein [Clostridia bacterium]
MEQNKNKWRKLLTCRMTAAAILIGLQMALILTAAVKFAKLYPLYRILSAAVGIGFTLHLIRSGRSTAYKLVWIVLILLFPVFGAAVYLIFCGNRLSSDSRERMMRIQAEYRMPVPEDCTENDRGTRFLQSAGYPVYTGTETVYYPSGVEFYRSLLTELEKAEKTIWMEYFIVSEGTMWDGIHRILRKKAADLVDVRLICDDLGCIGRLPRNFAAKLAEEGIRCVFFHRFIPVISAIQNNRDHRKICVIDGHTAFTGGINIGDEYIGHDAPFGAWKDCAVMLKGEAVLSLAGVFLTMWDYITGENSHLCGSVEGVKCRGSVQPYASCPTDGKDTALNVYLDLIDGAEKYLWIMTPYLIPDEATVQSLIRAARSGVDVRIITPGIPDKKAVYEATRANYSRLLESGVRIWEYTPGFLHSKIVLADEKTAVIGSVNLDYRSFYLHFECGVRMTDTAAIPEIRRDFIRTFPVSREITAMKTGVFRSLFRAVLELLSPIL